MAPQCRAGRRRRQGDSLRRAGHARGHPGPRERRRILPVRMPPDSANASLALMFVDVSGSTGLYEALGAAQAQARVDGCLRRLGRLSEEFNGRVIKTAGAGAFFSFPTADNAIL